MCAFCYLKRKWDNERTRRKEFFTYFLFNNVNEKTHLEKNWREFWIAWNIGLGNYQKIRFLRIIYFYRKPEANWGSSTQAQQFVTTLKNCHTLNEMPEHVKNYRFVPLESIPNNRLLKVSKSQKQFFLKLHCPKKRTKYYYTILPYEARAEFCQIFRLFFGQ